MEQREPWLNPQGSIDNREVPRQAWCSPLDVEVFDPGTQQLLRTVEVTTHDIAPSGFSFVCKGFIHPGSIVRTTLWMLPTKPSITGVVRNCNHVAGTDHRVGVQFIDDQAEAA